MVKIYLNRWKAIGGMKTKHQDIFGQKSNISPFPSMNVFLSRTSLEDSSHSTPSPLSSAASSQVRNQNREMLQLPQLSKIINFEFDRKSQPELHSHWLPSHGPVAFKLKSIQWKIFQDSLHTAQLLLNSNQFNQKYFRTPLTRPSCF